MYLGRGGRWLIMGGRPGRLVLNLERNGKFNVDGSRCEVGDCVIAS